MTATDLRPVIPWDGLLMCGAAVLNGLGMFAMGPWCFYRGFVVGGLVALVGGGGIAWVFGRELWRLFGVVRTRDVVGRARQERLEAFERAFSVLPPGERGPMLAGAIMEILDEGKRDG